MHARQHMGESSDAAIDRVSIGDVHCRRSAGTERAEEQRMSRLDEVIADLTGPRNSRRQFMARAAALGLTLPASSLLGGTRSVVADTTTGEVVWVSPRGTLEVLDDYAYWVAQRMGYLGEVITQILPSDTEASSSSQAVADHQADVASVTPDVIATGAEAG